MMRRLLLLVAMLLPFAAAAATDAAAGSSADAASDKLAPIPALTGPVVDTTGTLDADTVQQLTRQALDLQQRKGSQLQILMVDTTQPEDIFSYSQRVFDAWKLGRSKVDDAILVVVAKNDHRARIHTGYGLEGAIPDAIASQIVTLQMLPKFRAGDYGGGLVDATAVLVKYMDGEALPAPLQNRKASLPQVNNWVIALFAAFFVGQLVRGIFGWAPKPLRSVFTGGAAGVAAWFLSAPVWPLVIGVAVLGLLFGLSKPSPSRYAGRGGWGGGGWGGGGFGGGGWGGGSGGGGGWGGGGGMSGGGGASGSW